VPKSITAEEIRAALRPCSAWLDSAGTNSAANPAAHPADDTNTDTNADSGAADRADDRVEQPDRTTLGTAVRVTLRAFAQAHPGKAVEVRVPPFAAVQCLPGAAHTRGTPPHFVETDPRTWLLLATGRTDWATQRGTPRLHASGHRADDIGVLLPIPAATKSENTPE
jgi:hypothetical protein